VRVTDRFQQSAHRLRRLSARRPRHQRHHQATLGDRHAIPPCAAVLPSLDPERHHPAGLIESHYETNYGDAVQRLNALSDELATADPSGVAVNRLKRDQTSALNSVLLHELYFASLGGDGRAVPPVMSEAIGRDFGSVDRWRREFVALAEALAGGSGWVLLTWLPRDRRLINQSGADHNHGIAGGIPVLALDMYEHAYHTRRPRD